MRGLRGAITASDNTPGAILEAAGELLKEMARVNRLEPAEIACAFLTTTTDLDAEFPAAAARRLGWDGVALLCGHDMNVSAPNPRAVPRCIRVLLLYNTDRPQADFLPVYLRGAAVIKAEIDREREGARP